MEPIPESWPPSPEEGGPRRQIFPVFPLPRVWLFPHVVLPLQIFEERYKEMLEDSLDGPGRIVLATVQEGHEDQTAGDPPFYPVAGLGEIGRHDKLPDGRFQILLVGLMRVRVREVPSDSAYRKVEAEPLEEIPCPPDEAHALRERLVQAVLARTNELTALPPELPIGHVIDLLTLRLDLPAPEMNALFSELDQKKRALHALRLHSERPLPPEPQADDDAARN